MSAPLASPEVKDALIALSALQHQLFCSRQCALIHVEGLWADDGATAEGRILHERWMRAGPSDGPACGSVRRLALRSLTLGVSGLADVVEFSGRPPRPFPVEYKRGKPKAHCADEVQLCAQSICLEEMLGGEVPQGALFYGEFRFRGRSRRPPLDRLNALLSFLYTMLGHDCRSALEAHGLDPQVGFLYADRPGRAGLALDLMEELRPVLAEPYGSLSPPHGRADRKNSSTTMLGNTLVAPSRRRGSKQFADCLEALYRGRPLTGARIETLGLWDAGAARSSPPHGGADRSDSQITPRPSAASAGGRPSKCRVPRPRGPPPACPSSINASRPWPRRQCVQLLIAALTCSAAAQEDWEIERRIGDGCGFCQKYRIFAGQTCGGERRADDQRWG